MSDNGKAGAHRRYKKVTLRRFTVFFGMTLVLVGLILNVSTGNLSSFGWRDIAYLCPLGALEVLCASKTLVPRVVVAFAVVVVLAVVFGRVFCGWVCPVPPMRRFFGGAGAGKRARKRHEANEQGPEGAADGSASGCAGCQAAAGGACAQGTRKAVRLDSRHAVLAATLLSSFAFGYPVFCMVCPVGLSLGLVVALWFMFTDATVNLTLVAIPVVLIVELVFLRDWCHRFCPLGALMSLLAVPNRLFRPKVDLTVCRQANGVECHACTAACPEGLDPHGAQHMNECTKCGLCQQACPAGAIGFSPRAGGRARAAQPAARAREDEDETV